MKLEITVPVDETADNIAEALADSVRRIANSIAQFEITAGSTILSGTTRDDNGKAVGHFHVQ